MYAADSTTTLFETFDTNDGPQSRLAQSFHHARKLVQLEGYPVGIMTFGLSLIGTRNLESLMTEFERLHLRAYAQAEAAGYTIEQLATELHGFLRGKYDAANPPPAPAEPGQPAPIDTRVSMGVVVGGFSAGEFYPDEWLFVLPDGAPQRVREPGGQLWGSLVGCDKSAHATHRRSRPGRRAVAG